ncbi:hypothetical protein OUZ56_024378 [Daphnia magna]|uniref:Uncharacterized protein n=1 Tax=Daphnia magna TaxID=35525 RepID=A0ABR0B0Q2_9CRUS|nr:hypothetical protein OUZ56_024378 [Daphnia magna]
MKLSRRLLASATLNDEVIQKIFILSLATTLTSRALRLKPEICCDDRLEVGCDDRSKVGCENGFGHELHHDHD